MVFMPDTGVVVKVRRSGGEETSITIDGTPRKVRRYQVDTVDGKERYQLWLDEYQTPVMFSIQDKEGTVKFILAK